MRRIIMVMALGSLLAVSGLAIGSDTASRSAADCPVSCGPCPLPCATQDAAVTMGGDCSSSCSYVNAN
jgi:hypothetical protein